MKTSLRMSVMILFLAVCLSHQTFAQASESARITVNGSAGIDVNPDKVVISFGIETNDNDIEQAKQKNNEAIARVMAVFKDMKIKSNLIQTDHLSIEPRWYRGKVKEFEGYNVTNNVVVTLTDESKLEELITRIIKSGISYIHGIQFQVEDYKKYREEARVMALKAAREKAIAMAGVLDQNIGRPYNITEGFAGYRFGGFSGRSESHAMIQNAISNQTSETVIDGNVALGKLRISADVSVTFELLQKDSH